MPKPEQLPGQKKCGRKCVVMSRVVGFYTEVESWNPGKKEEYNERVPFNSNKAIARIKAEGGRPGFRKPDSDT
jgi:hypothetical protein